MEHYFTNNDSSIVTSNRILYTASSFARNSLLHLQEIGELEAQRPHVSSRSNLQSFLFFIVTSGSGVLFYKGIEYQLSKGDMIFIDCENHYSHTTDESDLWTLKWIHFYGPAASNIYEKYCERGGRPVFTPDDMVPFLNIWNDLMRLASSDDYIRDMKINAGLNELMAKIMEDSWHPEDAQLLPKKRAIVLPVKDYLDHNYHRKITLDDLAARFYINKYYLTKVFKKQYGQSINSYLLNLRITKAKQLLRFSSKTIEEIGEECGLGAPHYFSAKFKEVEGVSPSIYRKQW